MTACCVVVLKIHDSLRDHAMHNNTEPEETKKSSDIKWVSVKHRFFSRHRIIYLHFVSDCELWVIFYLMV